jgi:hypothetical protein
MDGTNGAGADCASGVTAGCSARAALVAGQMSTHAVNKKAAAIKPPEIVV